MISVYLRVASRATTWRFAFRTVYGLKRLGSNGQQSGLSPVELVEGEVSLGRTMSFARESRLFKGTHASAVQDGNPTAAEPTRWLRLHLRTRSQTIDQGRGHHLVGEIRSGHRPMK